MFDPKDAKPLDKAYRYFFEKTKDAGAAAILTLAHKLGGVEFEMHQLNAQLHNFDHQIALGKKHGRKDSSHS